MPQSTGQYVVIEDKMKDILLSSMTLTPIQTKIQKSKVTTQYVAKFVDYTAIADRHSIVSWSNYRHPSSVVNQFTGRTCPLTQ